MKQYLATIAIPGKTKAHVAIIPSTFRLIVHSPQESDKMCVSLNDRTGQLIYITLYPRTDELKTSMRNLSVEDRKYLYEDMRDSILSEISRFFTTGKDYNNSYNPVRNLDLDIWRDHWEECLENWIEELE